MKIYDNCLSYALCLRGEKSQWKTEILLKMGIKLHPKMLKLPGLLVLKRIVNGKVKCCGYFSHPLDDRHRASPEALGPAGIVVETRAKNCTKAL